MRLVKYINEKVQYISTVDEITVEQVRKECAPYLRLLGSRSPLLRGVDESSGRVNDILKKQVRDYRIPQGTSAEVFKPLNNWLQSKGFARRDKSVSATNDQKLISVVGPRYNTYVFFPIGQFKYAYVESRDFNLSDSRTDWSQDFPAWAWGDRHNILSYDGSYDFMKRIKNSEAVRRHYVDKRIHPESEIEAVKQAIYSYIHGNEGFEHAWALNFEVWFECKEYYLIPLSLYNSGDFRP